MNHILFIGIGRRKSSHAKVIIGSGSGRIFINGMSSEAYLQCNPEYTQALNAPLQSLGLENVYDITAHVEGGGLSGQVESIKLGLSRALCGLHLEKRSILKFEGYLKRDSRCKERKKYGLKKARKAPQFSKR